MVTRFTFAFFALFAVQGFCPSAFAGSYTPSHPDPVEEPWRWRAFPETKGIGVRCIAEGKDGAIWVGTEAGVRRYDGVSWRVYTPKDGPGAGPIHRIQVAPDSAVYVTTQEGVWRFTRWEWTRQQEGVSAGDPLQGQGAPRIQTRDGTVWVGGEGCLTTLRGGTQKVHSLSHVPLFGPILALIEARDGSLYLVGREEGLFRLDLTDGRYRTWEGLRAACQSSDGSLWFLTQDSGVVRQEGTGWTRYGVGEGMIDAPVCVVEGPDGTIYVAGSHRGVAATGRRQGGRWMIQTHPRVALSLRSACRAADGSVWFGGESGGLLRFNGAWHRFPDEEVGGLGDVVALAGTPDGKVWAGGSRGLRVFDGKAWQPVTQPEALTGPITALHTAPDGSLWAGTRYGGVFHFDPSTGSGQGGKDWTPHDLRSGLPAVGIASIAAVDSGVCVVAAHRQGVLRRDGDHWVPALDVALSKETEGLFQDRQGAIWINATSPAGGWKVIRYLPDRQPPETTLTFKQGQIAPDGIVQVEWAGQDPGLDTPDADLRYAYRLDRGPWSPFVAQQGYLFLSLPAGPHTFEVRARDRDFNVDPTPATHTFTVPSPPLRTPWWTEIGVLLLVGMVFLTRQVVLKDRRLSHYVSVISHDLRTPLTAIGVYLDNLLDGIAGSITDRQARSLRGARVSLDRLTRLIEGLLDLSKMESGRLRLDRAPFFLTQAIQEVVEHLQGVAREKGVTLRCAEGEEVQVRADEDRVKQVLTNLIDNALKFTPKGGRVEVEVQRVKSRVRVCVSDTGPGIPRAHQKAIFKKFHQVRKEGGTGLGLPISRRLVQMHGGEMWVESQVGEGSRFFFTLMG